ncbi:MAG TPA: aldehyde dehydrogenase (NADP(+)) [Amycolatopsis sp.]|nr:aldehyde dehydrogenase (NADP(+)) [Amycolatopsis sp.]
MTAIDSIDPTTGASAGQVAEETRPGDVASIAAAAARAAAPFRGAGRQFRATLLRRIADDLEARRDEIVAVAQRETGLAEARLGGELIRTAYQARFFAEVVEEGSYLEATIDHAGDTPMGPGPDLRRMLVPIGAVAVFGASNFPLAFSVPGGDTVAALAAGCPVIVKAHDSHPALSLLTFAILRQAAESLGAPDGVLGIVFGTTAGAALVADANIRAAGFTGSLQGGRALAEIAARRAEPIPFYGEMASLNPVVLSAGALTARRAALVEGFVASVTGSGGQLCTKPGIVLVPKGVAGDRFVTDAVAAYAEARPTTLLNARIAEAFGESIAGFAASASHRVLVRGGRDSGPGFAVTPTLIEIDCEDLDPGSIEECFGPASILIRYDDRSLDRLLTGFGGSLTATVHAEPDETAFAQYIAAVMLPRAGRLLFGGWPTGVLVAWAQTHGGPWPAASSQHTSVGATSIRRFLRPVTWQSAPSALLPEELADGYTAIPRRIDGRLVLAPDR